MYRPNLCYRLKPYRKELKMDEYTAYLYIKANQDWIVNKIPQGYLIEFNEKDYFSHSIEQAVCQLVEDCNRRGIPYRSISSLVDVDSY